MFTSTGVKLTLLNALVFLFDFSFAISTHKENSWKEKQLKNLSIFSKYFLFRIHYKKIRNKEHNWILRKIQSMNENKRNEIFVNGTKHFLVFALKPDNEMYWKANHSQNAWKGEIKREWYLNSIYSEGKMDKNTSPKIVYNHNHFIKPRTSFNLSSTLTYFKESRTYVITRCEQYWKCWLD